MTLHHDFPSSLLIFELACKMLYIKRRHYFHLQAGIQKSRLVLRPVLLENYTRDQGMPGRCDAKCLDIWRIASMDPDASEKNVHAHTHESYVRKTPRVYLLLQLVYAFRGVNISLLIFFAIIFLLSWKLWHQVKAWKIGSCFECESKLAYSESSFDQEIKMRLFSTPKTSPELVRHSLVEAHSEAKHDSMPPTTNLTEKESQSTNPNSPGIVRGVSTLGRKFSRRFEKIGDSEAARKLRMASPSRKYHFNGGQIGLPSREQTSQKASDR